MTVHASGGTIFYRRFKQLAVSNMHMQRVTKYLHVYCGEYKEYNAIVILIIYIVRKVKGHKICFCRVGKGGHIHPPQAPRLVS